MAANEITKYASELRALLEDVGANPTQLNALTSAAASLETLATSAPGPCTSGGVAHREEQLGYGARRVRHETPEALLGPLAVMPGLAELASNLGAARTSRAFTAASTSARCTSRSPRRCWSSSPPTLSPARRPHRPGGHRSVRRRPDRRVAHVAARRRQRHAGRRIARAAAGKRRVRRHAGTAARPGADQRRRRSSR